MTTVLGLAEGAIDVHTHYLPPSYRDALDGQGLPDNIPALPTWSASGQIGGMDTLGIATAMLSISSPGVLLPDPAATITLARKVNDDGAEAARDRPDRFGLLASLPLPDVDAALAEIRRAYDELGADGITMVTNYAGRYPADPLFRPVLAELDRREAVVLVHPVAPPNHESVSFGRPIPMLEFPFETTRAFTDLVLSGATRDFPRIRWIVSHAGAPLPVLAERVAWVSRLLGANGNDVDVQAEFAKLYYDLAGAPLPTLLPALLSWVGPDRVLYGSDMTFTPLDEVIPLARKLRESEHLDSVYQDVLRGHAGKLFPRKLGRG
ncbi:amidohydrolase family protein [Amycolatopsis jejuensis]|uniref:amidohydrolase family protein n=1 Tax=Amycolatopsis jejuensis TaxID=330084 RepID=UPI00052501FD|nr:amidohydrolase family protein [Amycolatopsis jejuensis]